MPTTPFWVAGEMIEPSLSEPIVSAAEAGRGGDARAARRAARVARRVVRVQHLAAERAVAVLLAVGDVGGELGQVDLAEDHGALRPSACARSSRRVSGTERSSTIEAAVVGIPATSMLSLSSTGRPSSGAAHAAGAARDVRHARLLQRVRVQRADRVDRRPALVDRGDAVDVGLRQLDARELACGELLRELRGRRPLEVELRPPAPPARRRARPPRRAAIHLNIGSPLRSGR